MWPSGECVSLCFIGDWRLSDRIKGRVHAGWPRGDAVIRAFDLDPLANVAIGNEIDLQVNLIPFPLKTV